MPSELAKDAIALLSYLLPGFLTAWVLYGLTSYPKPSQFERVVEALVFTFLIKVAGLLTKTGLIFLGKWIVLGPWDTTAELMTSAAWAIGLGSFLAYTVNTDSAHSWLRKKGLTPRTSHPSEWYYVLSQKVMFVVLHLQDGRRLYGWPKEWPIEPDKGQFFIQVPCWLTDDGVKDLPQVHGILVQAKDVKWVEFVSPEQST